LERLADTAGGVVVDRLIQRRGRPHPATFLTKGKLEELTALVAAREADLAVFDEDLSPAQVRHLEKQLNVRVLDRSELILDIFAKRARTREARLQVELAQLQYTLPRLTHMWQHLSRTGGGIGTRGPGETQLEVDRRRARERIARLKDALSQVERERETQRKSRRREFRIALVGYTNAGKSTLFNALTRAAVPTEDRLFATLDATTRRMALPPVNGGKPRAILATDTVGFIRKLPHHLVASFRSTLTETLEADLLVIVADAADPEMESQLEEVERVLDDLGAAGRPRLLLFNKIDRLPGEEEILGLRARFPEALFLSARGGEGLDTLRARLSAEASRKRNEAA
jgi:GTP-binding protein HflX